MEGGELFRLDPPCGEGERGEGRDVDASRIANEPKKDAPRPAFLIDERGDYPSIGILSIFVLLYMD